MFSLTPKEDKFYNLFVTGAEIINDSAKMLRDLLNDFNGRDEKLKQIKEMEHKGDRQQHKILEELNKTFITPFDREDIYMIAKKMDDIIDFIDATACRFGMFNIDEASNESKVLGEMIVRCSEEIVNLMHELKLMNKSTKLNKQIIEINRIEEEGDITYRSAITKLFTSDMPALEVMKWREIYEYFEQTLDACETVANIVEGVVMKNA